MIQQTQYVSIPRGLPTKLVKSNRELKAVAVWYQLKSLLVGGYIRDFGQNAKDIAATFGYSESKLRKYVAVLQAMGYIERPNRHDLVLRSSKLLGTNYGVAKTYYRVASNKLHQLELELRALALRENLERQTFVKNKKLQEQHLHDNGILISSNLQPAARRRALRGYSESKEQAKATSHFVRQSQSPVHTPALNPFVTLSRAGIARSLSRKSKATGHRYAAKLVAAGLMSEKANHVFVCDATLQEYGFMRESGYDHSFLFKNGQVVKALSNNIVLSPSLC